MNVKIEYKNDSERHTIMGQNTDKYLIEEQNITEGNFLIFSDEKPVIPVETVTIPQSEYEDLQNQLLLITNQIVEGGIF